MKLKDSSKSSRKNNKAESSPKLEIRLAIFGIIAVILFGILLGRLWYLQVLAGEEFDRLSEENRLRAISLNALRGLIYDRNNEVLATNRPSLALSVVPAVVKEKKEVLPRLAKILNTPQKEIEKKLAKKDVDPFQPLVIHEDVEERVVAEVKEHQRDFPGVEIEVIGVRDYPQGPLAAHVLGYVGEISGEELQAKKFKQAMPRDIVGKMGIENSYDDLIRGGRGEKLVEVDAVGRQLRVVKKKDSKPGYNLVLTLDKNIQQATEETLKMAISWARRKGNRGANAGAAVVMNVQNGEVLALASYPTYDPRLFIGGLSNEEWANLNAKEDHPLNNRAIQGLYPPGSTFKVVTGMAALTEGLISPKSGFFCAGKWTALGKRWTKSCWFKAGHGGVGFIQGIVVSCDTVFYEIGLKLHRSGGEKFQKWARYLGLGKPTGIDLPGEAGGRVPDAAWKKEWNKNRSRIEQKWYAGDTVNMAIGQGDMLTTPLQMAAIYATIANGGTYVQPQLLRQVLTPEGRVYREFSPKTRKTEFSTENILALQTGLRGVVTGGTGREAFAGFPVPVAGKTGTSQVRGKDDFAWFIGYAPANNPQYVVAVLVEEGGHGGSVSAPAVRNIFDFIFQASSPASEDVKDASR